VGPWEKPDYSVFRTVLGYMGSPPQANTIDIMYIGESKWYNRCKGKSENGSKPMHLEEVLDV
jgi:hypothetical protein